MLRIHQPYIKKKKVKYFLALASIGALLLGSVVVDGAFSESSTVQAAEIKYMQQFTNPICQSMNTGDTMDLIDPRGESKKDFQTYRIVKLRDGKCWMQENLRLTVNKDMTIEGSTSSGAAYSWTVPSTAINTQEYSTSGSWTSDNAAIISRKGTAAYGNGYYYSWCAATAGTCPSYGVASASICPRGWRLPTGNTNGEFYNLFGAKGINLGGTPSNTPADYQTRFNVVTASPYDFPAAGFIDSDGTLSSVGVVGAYWSSTIYSSTSVYFLNFHSDFYPGTNYGARLYGYSVRCVADPSVTTSDFEYEDEVVWEESDDGNVSVNVPSILTIDAVAGMEEVADAAKVIEGTATATISSNTAYAVTLRADQPALNDAENAGNEAEIAPVSAENPVQPGNNAWGFWDGSGNASAKLYTVPITTTGKEFYNTTEDTTNAAGDPAKKHTYYVGISISPSLPSGTYGTEVTITAATK